MITISSHTNSTTCVNPERDFIIPPSAKYYACGMPTTILGLRCANPACKMPCHGSLEQMCKQTVCFHCQSPLLFSLPARDRMEIMKEYTTQAALVKYDDTPPALLSDSIPKLLSNAECEDKVIYDSKADL